mmetsp:Transcript_5168/g.8799  ORF Transcript_5168/g.8799 Transcript_5168/m.8799 type:complete len:111 (-) Transcript_5168:309-641(-)
MKLWMDLAWEFDEGIVDSLWHEATVAASQVVVTVLAAMSFCNLVDEKRIGLGALPSLSSLVAGDKRLDDGQEEIGVGGDGDGERVRLAEPLLHVLVVAFFFLVPLPVAIP